MSSRPASIRRRKIRFAVVGLGHIAQVAILPGFKHTKHAELAALVSGDPQKRKKLGKLYSVPAYSYAEYGRCLADPTLDAVFIALPNDLHFESVVRAAEAGKHIICEKPLAVTAAEAREMMRAADRYGVELMTAYRLHFEPAHLDTLKLIRSGKLGEARYFTSSFSYEVTDPENIRLQARRGGGPMLDIGIYCLNAARQFMGAEPVEISAFFARTKDPKFAEVEETASVILRFPQGRLASFVVSFGAASVSRCLWVGTKGSVALEPAFEYAEALRQIVVIHDKSRAKTFAHTDQFGGEIDAFSECLLANRRVEANAEEGYADLRAIDAIFESARTGRTVALPPFARSERPRPAQVQRKPAPQKTPTVRISSPHD